MKIKSKYLYFSLYFLLGSLLAFAVYAFSYVNRFGDDFWDRNLHPADLFDVIFSGALVFSAPVFLYAITFSVTGMVARKDIRPLRWTWVLLFLIMACFGFYLKAYFIPRITHHHHVLYWGILENENAHRKRVHLDTDLIKGGYVTSTYTEIGKIIDSLITEKDSTRQKMINDIRDMASPAHVVKLMENERLGKLFTAEDLAGVTPKGRDRRGDSLAYYLVELRAQMLEQTDRLKEEVIQRYRNERTRMIFFPFHVLFFAFIAFLGGIWLNRLKPFLRWLLIALALAPFSVMVQILVPERGTNNEMLAAAPGQWKQIVFEVILLFVLWWLYRKKNRVSKTEPETEGLV